MANLKSSKKDIRRNIKKTIKNASQKSKVRTFLKKAREEVATTNEYKDGMKAIVLFEKNGMIATKNGLFSKKSVSRKVSILVKKLKSRFEKEQQVA